MDAVALTVAALVDRARALAAPGGRAVLGVTGPPGAGKTTLARAVAAALGPQLCALVPMDGFHLSNATLRAWDRRDRKGAPDTFDVGGYLALLHRLRAHDEDVVHAPDFDRAHDESIGSAIPVPHDVPLVLTEGNYLLTDRGRWSQVAQLLDESWYVELDDPTRHERLTLRHEAHGMGHADAVAWTMGSDETNAGLIVRGRERADLVVRVRTAD
ncbi:nucleoside/nucleotide kinase family protein [Pseudonocardia sp. ICBG601]|uniref:nucleoside/nucleotide kinase family protein n=1 Tax=Pseudonocardia sp. ICBG601 TaxID=2846759 RepID=UPI001CF6FD72|nr:nucleoside/nucleotide kinase family protein [Pseudonocardia sp. ICBG601]